MREHLKKVLYRYKDEQSIILVLDNVRYHHAKMIKNWLAKKEKITLFFLPPYSPELNAIERAWWYMRKKITSTGAGLVGLAMCVWQTCAMQLLKLKIKDG